MGKHTITEAELARQTGIPQPTLHKVVSGKTPDPRLSTLKALAEFFELNINEFDSDTHLRDKDISRQQKIQSVPAITWQEALNDKSYIAGLTTISCEQWVTTKSLGEHVYGLITKPSMEARFPRGTTLIIDSNIEPSDGDLVVVQYPNTTEAILRELSIDGPNKLLVSLNQNMPADQLEQSIKIVGTVAQSRFSY